MGPKTTTGYFERSDGQAAAFIAERSLEEKTMPMTRRSLIDDETVRAYETARYEILGARPFVLTIGKRSPALLQLYEENGVDCAAVITACNPEGVVLDDEENTARTARLYAQLAAEGFRLLGTRGCDPKERWPAEQGFLVPGLGCAVARRMGQTYDQNAVVWCGAGGVPELLLLR